MGNRTSLAAAAILQTIVEELATFGAATGLHRTVHVVGAGWHWECDMAIWQFAILAVPAQRIRSRVGDCALLTAEDLIDEDSVHGVTETIELQTALSRILPPARSWSPVVRKWGDIEGDDVTLVFEKEVLQEVAIRIDLRTCPERFIDEIASLGQAQDWLFISDSGRILPPTVDALRQEIAQSDAARFISDPKAFLDQLGNDLSG